MNVRRVAHLTALLLLVTSAGCSGLRITTDFDPAVNLTALRTYDWRPGPQQGPTDPRIDNSLLDMRVRSAVDRTLAARGFRKITSGTPDFLVGYHVVLQQKTDFHTVGGYYGYRWGGPPATYAYNYEEGTLLLDIIAPETMKLLWRGNATSIVRPDATPEAREKRINEAVEKILAEFPPK
jgi:hypothetical protein